MDLPWPGIASKEGPLGAVTQPLSNNSAETAEKAKGILRIGTLSVFASQGFATIQRARRKKGEALETAISVMNPT
ncbi:MAG TPA: hypothetical protein VG309_01110 [Rhizomicrobium sp.]|jgi:hypothetical protein|nr:hypothetical protein [Rhizomicrobium sp.]